ncbi:MAG: precorrin-2 C(20)-methyltransferase [Lachnospiraceae bacterium]|nr:precorrin-2 C(20)-methyltransferase [Lachnospiraceae bacterium]
MTGILYGTGVGPGDPELMTLKSVRLIRENRVIALPGPVAAETIAYRIAVQAVPELAAKTLLSIDMPMTHDRETMNRGHELAAREIEGYLKQGENVVFLTLGDPTIYSTYLYVQKRIAALGYGTELVSGITSFCAAAARTGTPLAEWDEQLHILPAVHRLDSALDLPGNYVLMKSGRKMQEVKKRLLESGRDVVMVENCGMENEHIYRGADAIPDDAGYYSLIIAKEPKGKG